MKMNLLPYPLEKINILVTSIMKNGINNDVLIKIFPKSKS